MADDIKDDKDPTPEEYLAQRMALAMIGAALGQGLTPEQRAAVLRACRHRIGHMERELEILADRITRNIPGAQVAHDIVHAELELLAAGVREIWKGGD